MAVGLGREGHPTEAAVSGCDLETWSVQLACPSLSCCMGTDLPGHCESNKRAMFCPALHSTKCVLRNPSVLGSMET